MWMTVLGLVLVMAAGIGAVMLNEVSATATLTGAKNGATINIGATTTQDLAGDNVFSNVQNIGTATEALDFGEAPFTIGYLFVKNVSAANFVELGLNTPVTQKFTKLKPGQFAIFPPSVNTVYAIADTAAVNLLIAAVGV